MIFPPIKRHGNRECPAKRKSPARRQLTAMIRKSPDHPDRADALFYMGQSHEKSERKEEARSFYKKIISMPNLEEGGVIIKAKRALKELEK